MKKFFNTKLILVIIVLVAAFLRFYQLGINPPSLTWDETAWGYNAYSIGIDGRDEFGRLLPYDYLESFGDFKPPMYAYLSVIPVKIFGLNEFSTRFASAFFGTLTVLVTYFLVKALFILSPKQSQNSKKSLETESTRWRREIPIVATAFLAVSPWHIMLSRAAFEANVSTFFLIAGVTSFLYWIKKKNIFLILSVLSFVFSLYTFNSARVVAPLLVILLLVGFWKILWSRKNTVILAGIIGILLVAPLVPFLLSPQAGLRYKEVNIFSDPQIVEKANQQIANDNNAWWSKIIHNRRVGYSLSFMNHYLDNLSPDFLFIKGDGNPKFSTQEVGQMYIWSLPFFTLGILFLFKKREGHWWIVPAWLLLGIIPAAVARETPHALRTEGTLPTFQILEAYGFIGTLIFVKEQFRKKIFTFICAIFGIIYLLNMSYFLHGYYGHYAWQYSGEWQYGYKDSITFVRNNEQQFDKIFVTDALGRPYIYYLFYLQVPPETFRKNAKIERDSFGFVKVKDFGKFSFDSNISGSKLKGKKVLYISDMKNIPQKAKVLKTFYLKNGMPVLIAYTM